MRKSPMRFAAGMAAAVAFLVLPAHAAEILNGGFEAGLANWTVVDQVGSEGTFTVQSGTMSPVTGMPVPAPPQGSNAAMTDAEGGGSHVLYQDFMQATPVASAVLSFDLFIGNRADAFYVPDPPTLDWAATPTLLNQQARVDILMGGTDPFSLAVGDLLMNLFATDPGDPLVSGYHHFAVDITALLNANLNQNLRLRFSEVDNVFMFQFGVDNVALEIDGRTGIPEPGSWLLILAGLAAARLSSGRALRR